MRRRRQALGGRHLDSIQAASLCDPGVYLSCCLLKGGGNSYNWALKRVYEARRWSKWTCWGLWGWGPTKATGLEVQGRPSPWR